MTNLNTNRYCNSKPKVKGSWYKYF